MNIRPILDTNKPLRGGLFSIKIYIYDPKLRKKKLVRTGYRVAKSDWDEKRGQVKVTRANSAAINFEIKTLLYNLESKLIGGILEHHVKSKKRPVKMNLIAFLNQYSESTKDKKFSTVKGTLASENYKKGLRTYLKYVSGYYELNHFDFYDVNKDFYIEFANWMRFDYNDGDGLGENTVSKAVEILRRLVEMAWDKGFHDNREAMKFTIPRYEGDQIYLSSSEIDAFMAPELPAHLETERQRFYISYNCFFRYCDSISIDPKTILTIDGKKFFNAIPHKTKDSVIIPIFTKTIEYLEKNNYHLPKTTNAESNRKLKDIGEIAGLDEPFTVTEIRKGETLRTQLKKWELITTHTARRSAATNYFLSMKESGSIDLKSLMLLGGWKSFSSMERYLKIGKLENAISAADHPFFKR